MLTAPATATLPRVATREKTALAVLWSGCIVYGAAAALLTASHVHHFELAIIALQVLVLLPAAMCARRFTQVNVTCFRSPFSASAKPYILSFLVVALLAGYIVGRGILIPDESAYAFQATIFANDELSAPAPAGAVNTPHTQLPVDFLHHIVRNGRWFSKYPVGWPAVLAFPEKFHLGWAVAPLLGVLLLAITSLIAREAFGRAAMAPSLWIAVLSPFWLATCVGRLSEALSAVLVAGACLCCLRAIRTQSLRSFALMYAFLVPTFLVRPYTALIASLVYGIGTLLWAWRNRPLFFRLATVSAISGSVAIALTALFNFLYTGSALLSPYAVIAGRAVPSEITASPAVIFTNLLHGWRGSAQSVLAYTFPFVFLLAIYGFWRCRRSWQVWILAMLFPALVIGYLVDTGGPSSVIGERYWFEGFIGIAVLAGQGIITLVSAWRVPRRLALASVAAITCAQIAITGATVDLLYSYSRPYAVMRVAAAHYTDCGCAVFIGNSSPAFYSRNLNLNTANWGSAKSFYFNDPGPEARQRWANRYGWHRWTVLNYDPATGGAIAQCFKDMREPQVCTGARHPSSRGSPPAASW